MTSALVYLAAASLRNRTRRQLLRLRSPRYLVALLAGGAYMWWFLLRPAQRGGAAAMLDDAWALRLASLGFALLAAKWWVVGADERALAFTPAELHLLFPAPITRRALVATKLVRAQLLILVNTVVWSVLLRGDGLHLSAWRRALGLWILFSTLYLHRLGAALTMASIRRHGGAGRRRQLLPALVVGGAAAALLYAMTQAGPAVGRAWTFGPLSTLRVLGQQLDAPVPRVVLAPFRALLGPALAVDATAWLRTVGVALALLALHALWVLRTDAAFEEAAVEASERLAVAREARARRSTIEPATTTSGSGVRRRRTIPLRSTGLPAVAILWKNAIAALRAGTLVRQLVLLGGLAVAVFLLSVRDERVAEVATIVAAVWGAMLVLAGPLWVRFDLRQDMPNLAILRAWPLSGRQIVAAQIAASTAALTVFQYLLIGALLAASALGRVPLAVHDRVAFAAAAALALPGINAANLTVQNAAVLLLPGWVRTGGGARGVEAMGQSLVSIGIALAILSVLLAAPAALAWGAVLAMHAASVQSVGTTWVFVPAAAVGTLAAAVELVPILTWLGHVFERTEPTTV